MSGDPSRAGIWPDADVYVAPLGTAPPTVADAFGAGWDMVGLLDGEAGFVQAREEQVDDHYAWGGILVRTSRRNFKQAITFTALEDNETTRALVWPQSAAGQIVVPRPERVLVGFEVREGDVVKRLISAYEAEVTVSADITDAEGDLTRYELFVTAFPDADGVLFVDERGDVAVTESFDGAEGTTLGPDLRWSRHVFGHAFTFEADSGGATLAADAPGSWEDFWQPHPGITSPDVEVTLDVTDLTRGLGLGAAEYVVDVGAVVRAVTRDGNTNYRGYAAGIGRNNKFLAPGHTWHLTIFRVDGTEVTSTLLDIAIAALADVALPGTFTFTADGPNLSATFEHAGPGATLSVDAVDATYADGFCGLGGSVVIEAGDDGSITVDNFAARAL